MIKMRNTHGKRQNNIQISIYLLMFLAVLYFSYHIVNGNHGLIKLFQLRQELQQSTAELKMLSLEKEHMERNIRYLHPNHLNLDFLDEIARKELGFIAENELLIIPDEDAAEAL